MAEVSLLPQNATPWLTAQELTDAKRWLAVDPDYIRRQKDPLLCEVSILPLLAWERSVDLWVDEWPEAKRRDVVDRWHQYERLKGTPAAIRRFVALVDGTVEGIIRPPQGVYPGADLTDDEQAGYYSQLSQVRVHRFYGAGIEAPGFYAGADFYDEDYFDGDAAYDGYRKHAVLVAPDGTSTDLTVDWTTSVDATGLATEIERVFLPADPEAGFFAGVDCYDEDFFDAVGTGPRWIEIATGGIRYRHSYDRLQLGYEVPRGLRIAAEPQAVIEPGKVDTCGVFADDDCFDGYWMPDDGWQSIYDRYWVHNPLATTPDLEPGGSYYDDAWFGWMPFTALARVSIPQKQFAIGAEEFFDDGFFLPPGLEGFEQACEAAYVSKSARDTIYLQPATYRWPRLSDGLRLDGTWHLGEMIKDK